VLRPMASHFCKVFAQGVPVSVLVESSTRNGEGQAAASEFQAKVFKEVLCEVMPCLVH